MSAVQLIFVRLALGAAVLIPFVIAREKGLPQGWTVWAHLAVAALLANAIPYTLLALAERDVPSSLAGVINATMPLWTLLFELRPGNAASPRPASPAWPWGSPAPCSSSRPGTPPHRWPPGAAWPPCSPRPATESATSTSTAT